MVVVVVADVAADDDSCSCMSRLAVAATDADDIDVPRRDDDDDLDCQSTSRSQHLIYEYTSDSWACQGGLETGPTAVIRTAKQADAQDQRRSIFTVKSPR